MAAQNGAQWMMTIREACSIFLDQEVRIRKLGPDTIKGYAAALRSLSRWADENGLLVLDDLDESAARAWVGSWTSRPSTTGQRLSQLKAFFRFTVERGWAARSPLAAIRPPRSSLDSIPLRPVTIPLEVTHMGGATEADYEGIPASVTFGPNERQADFILRAVLDQQDETGEGLRIDFGPLPPGVRKGTWGPYETVEFVDTDPAAQASPSVAGPLLALGYPGPLDAGSQPAPRDFVVVAEAPGRARAMLAVTAVAVRGSDVVLELDRPVTPEETVTLTYLAAAMHPIRDAAGLPAATLAALLEAAQESAGTERLDLSSRNLTDVSALAGLTGLRELDLSGNAITDLSPLAGLTGLRELDLASNRIADLWPLAGLAALQRLDLADNRIVDVSTLTGVGGLEVLLLDRNQVADVQALSQLSQLANLGLSDNRIADIGLLAELDRLLRLDLSGNAVADVSAPGIETLAPPAEQGAAPLWIERTPAH